MASLLSRFTTFVPNTTILSNDHNQELNRIVNLLNGTTTNLKTVLKTSDAGDPPLELDQLSTGPIQEWYQGGILKASLTNTGGLTLASDLVVASSDPIIRMTDNSADNDSMRFDMAVADQWRFIDENAAVSVLAYTFGARVFTFEQIPALPAANPTTDNQAARKAYVDGKTVSFSASFHVADPSTANVGLNDFGSIIIPGGGTYTITKFKVVFHNFTHTSGGSLRFDVFQFGVGVVSTAALKLDDTNNTVNTVYTDDVGNFTVAEGTPISVQLGARSGTITERNVTVVIEGFRTTF